MRKTIRFDWAIKRLLRNKANFGILEGFLSELLGRDLKIQQILDSESNREHADNKANRVDLLVEDDRGILIIIEVQSNYMHDYLMRMLFGVSKLIVDYLDRGMPYSKVRKTFSINIVYFDLGHGQDYIYHGCTKFVGVHKNDELGLSKQEQVVFNEELIEKLYPEYYIIKVNQFDNIARNTLDEWINFMKNEKVSEGTKAKGLKEASEKLEVIKLSPDERREYERDMANERDNESVIVSNYMAGEIKGIEKGVKQGIEQGIEKGIVQGIEKGIVQGIEKGIVQGIEQGIEQERVRSEERIRNEKLEIATKCLSMGMSVADTVVLTGLKEDEIIALQKGNT